jgi:hypothetical protein
METYVKLCPECKTATALQAQRCHQCGHVYRTKFERVIERVGDRRGRPTVTPSDLGYWRELPSRHVRVLLDHPGVRQDKELLSWLGEARYHYDIGSYSDALLYLRWSLQRMPSLELLLFYYAAVCNRVLAISTTKAEREYAERHARFIALPRWLRWTMRSHSWSVRCKYCGRYTPYIEPDVPTFGTYPAINSCGHCHRSYAMPSWMWDGPEGRLYIYYRQSVGEDEFYEEFERDYDPRPRCDRRLAVTV